VPTSGEGVLPGPEAAASHAASEADATPRSLLGDALAEGEKAASPAAEEGAKAPEAAAKPGEEPAAEAAKVVTPPGEPIKWDYSIPETVKLDDAGRTQVNQMFADAGVRPDKAQSLVNYHAEQMGKVKAEVDRANRKYWNDLRGERREQLKADPVMGGSSFQTTQATARRMVDMFTHGWSDAEKREFERDIEITGIGDFPSFYRLLKGAARFYDEGGLPPSNPLPPPDLGKRPGRGRLRDTYGPEMKR
jgi:hypothetical protein